MIMIRRRRRLWSGGKWRCDKVAFALAWMPVMFCNGVEVCGFHSHVNLIPAEHTQCLVCHY